MLKINEIFEPIDGVSPRHGEARRTTVKFEPSSLSSVVQCDLESLSSSSDVDSSAYPSAIALPASSSVVVDIAECGGVCCCGGVCDDDVQDEDDNDVPSMVDEDDLEEGEICDADDDDEEGENKAPRAP